MEGAGGTKGGIAEFFTGLMMMVLGFYMLLDSILSQVNIGSTMRLYGLHIMGKYYAVTTGMLLVPFIFGIGMVFSNSKNWVGWTCVIAPFFLLLIGFIIRFNISFRYISSFEMLVIMVLSVGGLGLFIRSFRPH